MRPLKLAMTAFGPFPATETVNLEALGASPLFLIHGATGAGKTTILDGICFALYGKTTGQERDATQMRCDQALPQVLSKVELVFELAGMHYRIMRIPMQLREKARGTGFTTQRSSAELYKIHHYGSDQVTTELLSFAKLQQVDEHIYQLTGLTVEQFRQVMILPQGQFRQLLLADSRDRERIFGQLFQTQIYQRIEDTLAEEAKDIVTAKTAVQLTQTGILESVNLQTAEELQQALLALEPTRVDVTERRRIAVVAREQAAEHLLKSETNNKNLQLLQQKQQALEALRGRGPAMLLERKRYQVAQEALVLVPAYQLWQSSVKQCGQLGDEFAAQQNELIKAELAVTASVTEAPKIQSKQTELEAVKHQLLSIQALSPRKSALMQAHDKMQTVSANCAAKLQLVKRGKNAVATTKQSLADLLQKMEQFAFENMAAAQQQLSFLEQQCTMQTRLNRHQQEIQKAEQALDGVDQTLLAAEQATAKQQRHSQRLQLAWHQGQASHLALQLQDNQPCPVCGSESHPEPAHTAEAIPSDVDLAAAEGLLRQTQQQQQGLNEKKLVLVTELKALNTQCVSLQQELQTSRWTTVAEYQHAILQLESAIQQQQALVVQQEALQSTLTRQQTKLEDITDSAAQLTAQRDVATEALRLAELELPLEYRAIGALEAAIQEFALQIDMLQTDIQLLQQRQQKVREDALQRQQQVRTTRAQLGQLQTREKHAQQTWQTQLEESSFTSATDFLAACLAQSDISALAAKLADYQRQLDSAEAAVASLMQDVGSAEYLDLISLRTALNTARQAEEHVIAEHEQLLAKVTLLEDIQAKLQANQAQHAELDERYAVIGTLSDTANGKTGHRLSLHRYVLSVILDDVLRLASQRLLKMSKGRYQLYRKLDRSRGNAASGLELMVEDSYTGKQRPAATLSGGESFIAALAMALGLSEVVQAYAGGIKLDTLFIDEGFGSLDPESLDLAVNTLMDLQATGRMVGVISHVPELKERINVRLQVLAGQQGSTTRASFAM